MKFITFNYNSSTCTGLWLGERVLNLSRLVKLAGASIDVDSMLQIIAGGEATLSAIRLLTADAGKVADACVPASQVTLLSPIPRPLRNIFCVGRNYLDHVKEGYVARGMEVKLPEAPHFFTKATNAMTGPETIVEIDPQVSRKMDYEVELAVVIGKRGKNISRENALQHVFGYSICNDVTARDLQKRHEQFFKGKSLDTSFPFGPWIVDAAEIGDPTTLELSFTINGQERQRATVAQLIFDIPTLIESLSAGMTLEAGDILATGTPSGVGFAMDPPQWLVDGDIMVASIDRIGQLRNTVKQV
jgi:2-keto-4-pentenoate hydratase/2-oxohepta-3-ene-1,7-dioic acid hydratase in catechol pathway